PLVIDVNGNLYGVTSFGGANGEGVAFELSPNADRTAWTFSILHNFCSVGGFNCTDGRTPAPNAGLTYSGAASGVLYDGVSPLYGTAYGGGGHGYGVIFELLPSESRTSWTQNVLYSFCAQASCTDGSYPAAAILVDGTGNLFGTTWSGGGHGQGAVFELSPTGGGAWSETVLYS